MAAAAYLGEFDRIGGFDIRYRIAADYDAMLRYLVRGEIRLAGEPVHELPLRPPGGSSKT